ncbi:MAG: hypothetical protein OQK12_05840 [Motiliproteus sp.]|nr:hypothetical protein [Motiliproteus sp.]MCW9054223.1 hypothetical protein [Motiliproteus sp.]
MSKEIDKQQIRNDYHLRWMRNTSIPLAIICIAALWIGREFHIQPLGTLFIILMPITMVIGVAYNIRFLLLAARQRRQSGD